jgi:branched-chain amino acid transport system permease protein
MTGCIYALLAMGYTLIYSVVDTINLAHGEVFIFGAMISASIARRGGLSDASSTKRLLVLALMLAAAAALSAVISGLVELTAFRPLRNAPRLAPLVALIGIVFILENILLVWQSTTSTRSSRFFRADASSAKMRSSPGASGPNTAAA